jgi:hypothetical protein
MSDRNGMLVTGCLSVNLRKPKHYKVYNWTHTMMVVVVVVVMVMRMMIIMVMVMMMMMI